MSHFEKRKLKHNPGAQSVLIGAKRKPTFNAWNSSILQSLLALVVFSSIASVSIAQSIDQQISRLINLGQLAAAETLLESSSPNEIDRLFFVGRIQKIQQRYLLAIATFREILRRNPDHINAKRELAHTLLLAEEYQQSRLQFRELLRTDNNDEMILGYRNFLRIIDQNRPTGINLQFGFVPSTNINNGTYNTIFDSQIGEFIIDPSAQFESGLGIQLALTGYFRKRISSLERTQINWSISGVHYDVVGYDSATAQLSFAFSRETQTQQWSIEPFARLTWQQDGDVRSAYGANFTLRHQISPNDRIDFGLLHEIQSHLSHEYMDGNFSKLDVELTHRFNPNFSISLGVEVERSTPQADHLKFSSFSAILGVQTILDSGTALSLHYRAGERIFVGNYPLTGAPRSDDFSRLGISISNSSLLIAGATPMLSCSLTFNRSNVAFYEYNAATCWFGFSRAF